MQKSYSLSSSIYMILIGILSYLCWFNFDTNSLFELWKLSLKRIELLTTNYSIELSAKSDFAHHSIPTKNCRISCCMMNYLYIVLFDISHHRIHLYAERIFSTFPVPTYSFFTVTSKSTSKQVLFLFPSQQH